MSPRSPNYDDALVISVCANALMKRLMVDTGSSTDILYMDAFQKLGLIVSDLLSRSSLTRFTGDSITLLRTTILPTTLGQEPESKILMVTFMVVGLSTVYNIILGRPTLNRLRAVVSTYHRTLKFPTKAGVGEVKSDP
ncbi:hypothetical protein B296_00005891 [Ensete ventricosum]|uniref:Peptidase A2 domain-containing protein n=1 Tax=Ensete ventricosum TaxID=4639 RepID=A0A426YB23_ENSVE|nr:hypothetical protein B296_00005891 [Ensete ventricosum]